MKKFRLPANSSRYFNSNSEAISQVPGEMLITSNPNTGHLYNSLFSDQHIHYDSLYSTENPFHFALSTSEIMRLLPILSGSVFVEIGCGQGELIDWLRSKGEIAFGFDPVCRKSSDHLVPKFFSADELKQKIATPSKIVFVMRCVLPHIEEPFQFITEILHNFPHSRFLMQHQRIEHYLLTTSWNGLMHDHVNIFLLKDFDSRYNIEDASIFCGGEWQQILISPSEKIGGSYLDSEITSIEKLLKSREGHLEILRNQGSVYLFGAAGKGANFAFACTEEGINLQAAIDDSSIFNGKYMEGSGVRVCSPGDLDSVQTKSATMIVMNHNHLALARERFSDFAWIESLRTL